MTTVLIIIGVFFYLAPAISAYSRHHRNADAILLTDLLLGWTIIGWIVAAIWSATDNVEKPA